MKLQGPLREGITTGSCAAAATWAAGTLLKEGVAPQVVEFQVPGGTVRVEPLFCRLCQDGAEAGVIKDGGDDPDVTHGMTVISQVRPTGDGQFSVLGGQGVGTVTLPGLKIPPGQPAINPMPRAMIERALRSLFPDGAEATISIPGGEAVAQRTYNPRLGIVGGLSVLGTTGIVRPMSDQALRASLAADLDVRAATGRRRLAMVFGNMGETMTKALTGLKDSSIVSMGNEVGFMLTQARHLKVQELLLCGHLGKMIKLAGGIFNTHSRVADGRMEVVCTLAALQGASRDLVQELYRCTTTEAAMALIDGAGLGAIWEQAAERVAARARSYVWDDLAVEAMVLDNAGRALAVSAGAWAMVRRIKEEE